MTIAVIHTLVGDLGHLSVIIAFVAAIISAISFYFGTQGSIEEQEPWARLGRLSFGIHALGVMGVVSSLFYIIYNHYYEYHYAWEHSSNHLPVHYMISCFWEGQEGSFLLWIFWTALIGLILIRVNTRWQSPVLAVFALVQAFLVSMILGVVIYGDLKIGSDPFILMRDAMPDAPIFSIDPDYVPEDGTGLNPLLQNYWMVIHPPTLFLGFALTLVPFAFCIAGLWLGELRDWVRPALPWSLLAAVVLGVGILMGAYWAYETLNFGGYWNWDPVENAIYVPWLILIGAIHTMIAYRKSGSALRVSALLCIATFILILYATFMTRSGILGESSVHSFTDLGLSGQLLIYLLCFTVISIGLLAWRWKDIPVTAKEASIYSREFWIFVGALVLCLAGFQVLLTTSIPVWNAIMQGIGVDSNVAPPADQIAHYTQIQLWFSVAIALLAGGTQYLWWSKVAKGELLKELSSPLIITLLCTTAFIVLGEVRDPVYMVLILAALFCVVANAAILLRLFQSNAKLAGGSVAHIGFALMLIGILFSSGYSKVISLNSTGMVYHEDFPEEMNRENVLLWQDKPMQMGPYQLTYEGAMIEAENYPDYISKRDVQTTGDPYKVTAKKDIAYEGKVWFTRGDTLTVSPENTYYEVTYKKEGQEPFTLYPRAQVNPNMGLIASPDIHRMVDADLYTHVSSIPVPDEEKKWSEPEEFVIGLGDTILVNDYFGILQSLSPVREVEGVELADGDIAVEAGIRFLGAGEDRMAHPTFVVKEGMVGLVPDLMPDMGIKIALANIDPDTREFTLRVETTQKDYIILKAMRKPLINVLWLGTLVMVLGFVMSIVRRYQEFKKMRNKEDRQLAVSR